MYLVLFLLSHCCQGLGVLDFLLSILNMISILSVDIGYKWIVTTLLSSDNLVVSLSFTDMFQVCHALSHGTTLSLVVLRLSISKWKLWAYHAWSNSGLTSGIYILSLISSTLLLSSLRAFIWVLSCPTFTIALILSCITIEIPGWVHHCLEIHIIIDACRDVCIVLNKFL